MSTIADSAQTIPIIIQSFDKNALTKMATLTDLPLVQLCNDSHINDYDDIASYAHGVGVPSDWIMNKIGSSNDDEEYSQYIRQMHKLELAVHPYTDQDDHLHYEKDVYDEAAHYVNKGVDGLFVEFPHAQLVILEHLGTKADFPAQATAKQGPAETKFLSN